MFGYLRTGLAPPVSAFVWEKNSVIVTNVYVFDGVAHFSVGGVSVEIYESVFFLFTNHTNILPPTAVIRF